jgi:hypothetical protein
MKEVEEQMISVQAKNSAYFVGASAYRLSGLCIIMLKRKL